MKFVVECFYYWQVVVDEFEHCWDWCFCWQPHYALGTACWPADMPISTCRSFSSLGIKNTKILDLDGQNVGQDYVMWQGHVATHLCNIIHVVAILGLILHAFNESLGSNTIPASHPSQRIALAKHIEVMVGLCCRVLVRGPNHTGRALWHSNIVNRTLHHRT